MEFNYFDIVASIIILLLGLKGILNGFFKELFGLIGIIGGIFIASRFGLEVGNFLNDLIFNFANQGAISFTGFLVTLGIFWLIMILVGSMFKKLVKISGLGVFDRMLGFIFGAGKFFLITAVIVHAVYNIQALRGTVDSIMENSILFPIFEKSGSVIMKVDPTEIANDVNMTISETTKLIEEKTDKLINKESLKIVKEVKEKIQEQFDQNKTKVEDK